MKPIVLPLYCAPSFIDAFVSKNDVEMGQYVIHAFPDEETSLQILSDVKNRAVILIATLDRPNDKCVPLLFAAQTAKALGAVSVGLIAPYLAYMRQDKAFHPGEGITSAYFAQLISSHFDWMMTIDPHLHRYRSLDEIYTIPTTVLHATSAIAQWLKTAHADCLLIGPDQESRQWVAEVAQQIQAPFVVLEKKRFSDRQVEITLPDLHAYAHLTPVILDDVISSAMTMIETIHHLNNLKMKAPICVGVHGIFAGDAYEQLRKAGAAEVATCDTIAHVSNKIKLGGIVACP